MQNNFDMSKIDDVDWQESICKLIARKRTHMLLDINCVFWANLSMRLKPEMSFECPSFGTDGKVLLFNPLFIQDMIDKHGQRKAEKKIVGTLAHEAMHCAFGHMVRRGNRDFQLFNFACDYAINSIILDAGFELPDGILVDEKYRDMSAEAIYEHLVQDKAKNPDKYPGDGGGGFGEVFDHPGNDPGDSKNDDESEQEGSEQDKDGKSSPGDSQGSGKPGPGQGGKPKYLSDAEKKQISAEWAQAARIAADAHKKSCGTMPGQLKRVVDRMLDPKVPWVDLVREWADVVSRGDYTWSRPNFRYMPQGCYLPSLYSVEVGEIAVILDVSGSISDPQFTQFASEISSILEEMDCKVYAIYVDTAVRRVDEFEQDDLPLRIETTGGGGTDFRPGFKWIEEKGIDLEGLIYFTDMECSSFPDHAPDYPVIWVKYGQGNYGTKEEEIPFGDYVEM